MKSARKRFGQNFLIDAGTISEIINAINPQPDQHIVEIGPGHGAITDHLVSSGCKLTLIEIDRDLAERIGHRHPGVSLIVEDVLKIDFQQLGPGPFRVVGNLPYNISTPLLFKLFPLHQLFIDMHFMLQREVVDRMVSPPSQKSYGRLSVMTQFYCETDKLVDVPPEAFAPPPKVNSAVIRLTPHQNLPVVNHETLQDVLRMAFSARRKTIRNGLSSLLTEQDLLSLNLNPNLRPENLSIEDFVACANRVQENGVQRDQ